MSDKSSLQDLVRHLHDASQTISSAKDAAQVGQALMGFASQAGVDAARLLLFPEVPRMEEEAPPAQDGEDPPAGDWQARSPAGSGLMLSDGAHPRDASATTYVEVREGWTVDDRPAQPYGTRLPLDDYPLLAFMHVTQPVVCEDVTTDPRANEPTRQLIAISGLASFLIVPLTVGDWWLGAFFLGRNTSSAYTDDLIYASWTLAGQAAAALESLRLLAEVERERQRYWDLYTAQKQVEEALRKANRELDCLNDIGRKINESPPIPEFLGWVTERIPPAMQDPDVCVAAIEFEGQLYGAAEALELPRQIVQGLRIHGELTGYVYISYREERDFLDAESMLLGDIVRRVSGYIESRRLFEQTQARARREQTLREITTRVRGLTDPDTIVRTAVRELGTALGRPTFVRLGGSPQGEELRLTHRDASATHVAHKGSHDGSDMAPQAPRPSPKGDLRAGKGGE
jgi:GAF domain-containing protein